MSPSVAVSPRWWTIYRKIVSNTEPFPRVIGFTSCWEWLGPTNGTDGYPRMSLDGGTVAPHRVMFMLRNGYIRPQRHVDHLCRNRCCVNPDHLEAVTHRQNQKRKKRAPAPQVKVVLPDMNFWDAYTTVMSIPCTCTGLLDSTKCKRHGPPQTLGAPQPALETPEWLRGQPEHFHLKAPLRAPQGLAPPRSGLCPHAPGACPRGCGYRNGVPPM